MLDQNTFTETIRAVQDIIRTSAEPMTREEILSYFKDMDLNAQQEEMVLEFLSTPHDDPQPEENEPETKEAEYEETAEKIFGSKQRAAMMMLGNSAMIVGRK